MSGVAHPLFARYVTVLDGRAEALPVEDGSFDAVVCSMVLCSVENPHRVVLRGTHDGPLMGIPATGRPGEVMAIAVNRLAHGKVAEIWTVFDMAGVLTQIGVLPATFTASEDETSIQT